MTPPHFASRSKAAVNGAPFSYRNRTPHLYEIFLLRFVIWFLKKNQNAPRPSEHPPVMGEKMSKCLRGIKGCKYKTSSWHLNRFPDADNIGSTV